MGEISISVLRKWDTVAFKRFVHVLFMFVPNLKLGGGGGGGGGGGQTHDLKKRKAHCSTGINSGTEREPCKL